MKHSKKFSITKTLVFMLFLSIIASPTFMMAWETPITIAGEGGHKYGKPEIRFNHSGGVHIVYRNKVGGNSDIYMCSYNGKEFIYENVSELEKMWPAGWDSYESDVDIDPNGTIHIAWIALKPSSSHHHHIMYRYKNENGWSEVFDLGSFDVHSECFDTRIGTDSSGNVHIVTYKEHEKTTWYVSKFGDVVTPIVQIDGQACKHPDIAVDDNYVYILYQKKIGFPYVQMLQKRQNNVEGTILFTKQLTTPKEPYASQKGRIDLDSEGSLHMLDFYKGGPNNSPTKQLYYYNVDANGVLKNETLVSQPGKMNLYHYAGLEVRDNSIIASVQLGSSSSGGAGIFYNWKKDGEWGGYTHIGGSQKALHQSVDLSYDGKIAAVTYITPDNKVHLISSEPISETGQLEADFTPPENIYYGSEVTFDASVCASLNPDYSISRYIWNFNGTQTETSSPTITFKFEDGISFRKNVKVSLQIEAPDGETGSIEKEVYINANYNATNVVKKSLNIRTLIYNRPAIKITWSKNPKNNNVTIDKYEVWRAMYDGFLYFQKINLYDIDSNTFEYWDFSDIDTTKHYAYIVCTVDSAGNVSPAVSNNQ